MQITIEIPNNRYKFFKTFLRAISFAKVVSINESVQSDTEIIGESVSRSLREVKAHKSGKKTLRDIKDRIHEL